MLPARSLIELPVVSRVKALCVNGYLVSQGGTVDLHAFLSAEVFVTSILTAYIFTYLYVGGAWICAHVMDQREIFAAVVTGMRRKLELLFKQSFSDSQTQCEDSEKDAGSDAKRVVSSNSFCRASFCWLESLLLKCDYPDVENRQSPATPEKRKFPQIAPSPSTSAHFLHFPDEEREAWAGSLCEWVAAQPY